MYLCEVMVLALEIIKQKYQSAVKKVEYALVSGLFCQDNSLSLLSHPQLPVLGNWIQSLSRPGKGSITELHFS